MNPVKRSGQVFTPDFIVEMMLDFCGYQGAKVLHKSVIDNSCGDGAFLCEVVDRYCSSFLVCNADLKTLGQELEHFVHGIERDGKAVDACLYNLDQVALRYGLGHVRWDIRHEDALVERCFDGKMDYVVGNPPYVRVHNLDDNYDNVKTYLFANGGMTDLFLAFFELGFNMLSPKGKLCYITPSSWLTSRAAENMRSHVLYHDMLTGVIDMGHYQAFDHVTTYTLVSLFEKGCPNRTVDYYTFNNPTDGKCFIQKLNYEDITINSDFYVSTNEQLDAVRQIKCASTPCYVKVKNGFATLADDVFIGKLPFDRLTIPVLKASTGRWSRCFFPYDNTGKPLQKKAIFEHSEILDYLLANADKLLKGKTEEQNPQWYLYGRTQALKDVEKYKIAVNTIIKDIDSIKLNVVPEGSGVYSGLYILSSEPFDLIRDILISNDFVNYIKTLKCYKSGGYYTFNSRDLEQFLNYKLAERNRIKPIKNNFYDQRTISQGTLALF